MKIPSDYTDGYAKARKVAPEIADNYLSRALIGDPVGEEMTEDLAELGARKS